MHPECKYLSKSAFPSVQNSSSDKKNPVHCLDNGTSVDGCGTVQPSLKKTNLVLRHDYTIQKDDSHVVIGETYDFLPQKVFPKAKEKKKAHTCCICHQEFSKISNLYRHVRILHKTDPKKLQRQMQKTTHSKETSKDESVTATATSFEKEGKHQCDFCGRRFSRMTNMYAHSRAVHKSEPELKSTFNCSECHSVFTSNASYVCHISEQHSDIILETENLEFTTNEEFSTWKLQMEAKTASSFISYSRYNKKYTFICHRSGKFESEGKGKRHLKLGGSHKIGYFCPARVVKDVHVDSDGNQIIKVTFQSTHVGHQCEIGKLNLTKPEKDKLAGVMLDIAENAYLSKRPEQEMSEQLVLDINAHSQLREHDKKAIVNDLKKTPTAKNWREEAKSAFLGFLPKLDKYTEEQCKEALKSLKLLEHRCEEITAIKNAMPLPVVKRSAPSKNASPQRKHPQKKSSSCAVST